jgi:hypothetical protein
VTARIKAARVFTATVRTDHIAEQMQSQPHCYADDVVEDTDDKEEDESTFFQIVEGKEDEDKFFQFTGFLFCCCTAWALLRALSEH